MIENESAQESLEERFLIADKIVFDSIINEVSDKNKSIKLAYTEARTLLLLIHHSGEIVPREKIIEFSWGGRIVTDSSLAKSISNIRKALRDFELNEDSIITVPRIGYRLTLDAIELKTKEILIDEKSKADETLDATEFLADKGESSLISRGSIDVAESEGKLKLISSFCMSYSRLFHVISLVFFVCAIYNFSFRTDQDLSKSYISSDYEKIDVIILSERYKVIKPIKMVLNDEIKSIIKLGAAGATVFIRKEHGVYNVSYLLNRNSMSFTFSVNHIDKAKCQIKAALYEGEKICAM